MISTSKFHKFQLVPNIKNLGRNCQVKILIHWQTSDTWEAIVQDFSERWNLTPDSKESRKWWKRTFLLRNDKAVDFDIVFLFFFGLPNRHFKPWQLHMIKRLEENNGRNGLKTVSKVGRFLTQCHSHNFKNNKLW